MSTKIYEAFRFHNRYFPALAFELREKAVKVARKKINQQYKRWIEAANDPLTGESFRKELVSISSERDVPKVGRKFTRSDASHVLSRAYANQFSSHLRSSWDMNASLTFRPLASHWYVIPYSGDFYRLGKGRLFDFLSREKKLSPYEYWNNVDTPPGVSERQWEQRRKNWEPLIESSKWPNFFSVDILTISSFYQVDPAFNSP